MPARYIVRNEGSAVSDGAPSYSTAPAAQKIKAGVLYASAAAFAELDTTLSLLALQVANNTNVALLLGDKENRVFDSFDALTYVKTGAATNLDSSTGGIDTMPLKTDPFAGL